MYKDLFMEEIYIMANRFVLNETSYHGQGAIQAIASEVNGRGFKKCFVCTDPDLIKFGVAKKVTDVLDANNIPYVVFSDVKANPTVDNVLNGVTAYKESGADCIVAIGGGSSIDTAKAIGIIITNPEFGDVVSLEGVAPTKNRCVPIIAVPTTAGTAAEVVAEGHSIWTIVLTILFFIGVAAVLANVLVSIISIRKIINRGSRHEMAGGIDLIITEDKTASFSWMKYIVISSEDYRVGCSQILMHERAHIELRHSWDLLFVDIITAVQWFNPAIWMLKGDLRMLHEFEADDAVLRSGVNIKEYQYLLIRKSLGGSGYSLVNNFNHSTLKQRISMMLNKKSSPLSTWKVLYIVPVIGIFLLAMVERKIEVQREKPIVISIISEDGESNINIDGKVCTKAEVEKIISEKIENAGYVPMVTINASSDVELGEIIDVKDELRKTKALKITYGTLGKE